jgi:dTDP-4-amino-4,6-dideoxygalactose transaminase
MVRLRSDAPVSRDQLMQELLDRHISTRRGIMAIHREAPYCGACWDAELPVTNLVVETGVILPLFHEMTEEDQDCVIDSIYSIGAEAAR